MTENFDKRKVGLILLALLLVFLLLFLYFRSRPGQGGGGFDYAFPADLRSPGFAGSLFFYRQGDKLYALSGGQEKYSLDLSENTTDLVYLGDSFYLLHPGQDIQAYRASDGRLKKSLPSDAIEGLQGLDGQLVGISPDQLLFFSPSLEVERVVKTGGRPFSLDLSSGRLGAVSQPASSVTQSEGEVKTDPQMDINSQLRYAGLRPEDSRYRQEGEPDRVNTALKGGSLYSSNKAFHYPNLDIREPVRLFSLWEVGGEGPKEEGGGSHLLFQLPANGSQLESLAFFPGKTAGILVMADGLSFFDEGGIKKTLPIFPLGLAAAGKEGAAVVKGRELLVYNQEGELQDRQALDFDVIDLKALGSSYYLMGEKALGRWKEGEVKKSEAPPFIQAFYGSGDKETLYVYSGQGVTAFRAEESGE